MNLEELKQFVKQTGWPAPAYTVSYLVAASANKKLRGGYLYNQLPELKKHIPDPAAPQYVIIKMTPDNIRAISGTDMKYEQVKLK
jgi:hypothetical protein